MHIAVLWGVTFLLFTVGLAGTFIPALPGIGLVYAGILFYALATGFSTISITTLIVLGVIALLALLTNYAGSVVGVQAAGGKRYAIVGAVLGTIIGVFFSPIGMLIGAFTGALIGAIIEGHDTSRAAKIAILSVIGTLGATIVQCILAVVMIAVFLIAIFI